MMKNPTILVVESETIIAKDLQNRLKKAGYTVAIASSRKEAIDKATEIHPDLLLISSRLKNIDSIDTVKQICNYLNIPVVYLTASKYDINLESAKLSPCFYLFKPFKEEDLYTTIKTALSKSFGLKSACQ